MRGARVLVVMARYPVARPGMEDWIVRLDADPKS